MTISAQNPKIAYVRFPVAEAAAPRPSGLMPLDLFAPVDVVNIQGAKIFKPAFDTLSAQRFYDCHLPLPIARMLVSFGAVLLPISLRAFWGAKLCLARLATLPTLAGPAPASGKIATLAAILSVSVSQPIRVHLSRFAAVGARYVDGVRSFLSHALIVSQYRCTAKPKYFDIACRRISEALKQPDMFIEKPKPLKQESLEL